MNDVRDILEVKNDVGAGTKGFIKSKKPPPIKRPEGMKRELFALLSADDGKNMHLAPVHPANLQGGCYKPKIKLGHKRCRAWKWTPFVNPARKDGFEFYHWKRETDEPGEYLFAQLNVEINLPKYSDSEYADVLDTNHWTKAETDHLFDLCCRFDLRFPIIQDRWNHEEFGPKSVEDLKERYYEVAGILTKLRADPTLPEPHVFSFDAQTERQRKLQLDKLWKRSPAEIEEEEYLKAEMEKIEMRKIEREKKTQDLQKLISAVDGVSVKGRKSPVENSKKKVSPSETKKKKTVTTTTTYKKTTTKKVVEKESQSSSSGTPGAFTTIKWPQYKLAGVSMRSSYMKLPNGIGKKKMADMELKLRSLGIELDQTPTEEIIAEYNELRNDIALLYELKCASASLASKMDM